MHPTDTEHKWPWGTDGEHVTLEAIMVQLSTNLSPCYKSHVYSVTPVSYLFKGGGGSVSRRKGQSITAVYSWAFSTLRALLHAKFSPQMGITRNSSCPPPLPARKLTFESKHLKELHWIQLKWKPKFSPLILFLIFWESSQKLLGNTAQKKEMQMQAEELVNNWLSDYCCLLPCKAHLIITRNCK